MSLKIQNQTVAFNIHRIYQIQFGSRNLQPQSHPLIGIDQRAQ